MLDIIFVLFSVILPTLTAIVVTCEGNVTRRARVRRERRANRNPMDASTPRTRTEHNNSTMTASEDRKERRPKKTRRKSRTVSVSGRPRVRKTSSDELPCKATKDQPTDRASAEARAAPTAATGAGPAPKNKSSGSSGDERREDFQEKTCREMGISVEENETQEETQRDTGTGTGTGTGNQSGTGTGALNCTGGGTTTSQWPVGMAGAASSVRTKTFKTAHGKSSVFDVPEKKEEMPSEFELDSLKRLQRMSRETVSQQNTAGSKEVVVEIGKSAEKPSIAPSPKKKKRDWKKEEEVQRWNEAIARGNVFRPRKDDETIDDVQVDWGDAQ